MRQFIALIATCAAAAGCAADPQRPGADPEDVLADTGGAGGVVERGADEEDLEFGAFFASCPYTRGGADPACEVSIFEREFPDPVEAWLCESFNEYDSAALDVFYGADPAALDGCEPWYFELTAIGDDLVIVSDVWKGYALGFAYGG